MMVMKILLILITPSMVMIEVWMTMTLLMVMIKVQDEDDDKDSVNSCDNGACLLSERCPFFHLGTDGERQTEGTDASRKRDTRSSAGHHKSEDTSDSREDEAAVSLLFCLNTLDRILMQYHNLNTRTLTTHIPLTKQRWGLLLMCAWRSSSGLQQSQSMS